MMASKENTGEKSKKRKQLVRQEAKTEAEQEAEQEVEVDVEVDSPPQCRIIYKETIDISASHSLPLSPPQSWLYGSNKYLAAQYSGHSFNRSELVRM